MSDPIILRSGQVHPGDTLLRHVMESEYTGTKASVGAFGLDDEEESLSVYSARFWCQEQGKPHDIGYAVEQVRVYPGRKLPEGHWLVEVDAYLMCSKLIEKFGQDAVDIRHTPEEGNGSHTSITLREDLRNNPKATMVLYDSQGAAHPTVPPQPSSDEVKIQEKHCKKRLDELFIENNLSNQYEFNKSKNSCLEFVRLSCPLRPGEVLLCDANNPMLLWKGHEWEFTIEFIGPAIIKCFLRKQKFELKAEFDSYKQVLEFVKAKDQNKKNKGLVGVIFGRKRE